MAAKSGKKRPASSSEEEFSEEDSQQKGESESEYEETDEECSEEETEFSKTRPKSVTENPSKKLQEEDGSSFEENSPEEEESEQEETFHDPKSVNKSNRKSKTEMVPPAADSAKIKSSHGTLKKVPIARIWSLEDEKTLLNSMLQFRLETGKEIDYSSVEYFCDFLKGKLSFTKRPKRRQVSKKIRSLKNKYLSNRFSKKRELELKEIAARIWKLDVNINSSERKFSLLEEEIGKLANSGLEEKLKLEYNVKKAEALEQKIKKQKISEMKLEMKRIDLKKKTFKLILDVLERSEE